MKNINPIDEFNMRMVGIGYEPKEEYIHHDVKQQPILKKSP
ncbi:hypothetical protein [Lentibacillus sediminis]|nr:hypothetical protein [Lentibacillus sediminis]